MIRAATEHDVYLIRALIESVPGFWHAEWRTDAIERAIRAADGLAFVWQQQGHVLGFACAHDVGFLGYLSLLVVTESAQGQGIGQELLSVALIAKLHHAKMPCFPAFCARKSLANYETLSSATSRTRTCRARLRHSDFRCLARGRWLLPDAGLVRAGRGLASAKT